MLIHLVNRIRDEHSLVLQVLERYTVVPWYPWGIGSRNPMGIWSTNWTFPNDPYIPTFQKVKFNFKMYFLGIVFLDLNFLRY